MQSCFAHCELFKVFDAMCVIMLHNHNNKINAMLHADSHIVCILNNINLAMVAYPCKLSLMLHVKILVMCLNPL